MTIGRSDFLQASAFWIDLSKEMGGVFMAQVLPFVDAKTLQAFYDFEQARIPSDGLIGRLPRIRRRSERAVEARTGPNAGWIAAGPLGLAGVCEGVSENFAKISAPGLSAQLSARAPADRHASSSAAAYATIKARILDSELAPGAHVLEQTLAQELRMSRTPVREALVRLQQEGLLEIVPRHGVRIATLAPSDMREIYEVLISLEPTAIELLTLARPSRADLSTLLTACDNMERALARDPPDLRAWAAADEQFHIDLALRCGNRRLAGMIMTVWEQAHRARMFTLTLRPVPHRSTAEHRAVVEAVLAGDEQHSRRLYEAHRRRGGKELMAIIERHGIAQL
ncbi:MAG TPA: GntR family transcriptional regulator [Acetobacteraceae bacterium]|nr:GntR family transcriptional regulator [Acetobacteraceae bacterium]